MSKKVLPDYWNDNEPTGYEIFGEVEWSSGCYEFDTTLVVLKTVTGELFYTEDSGCSCPSPFEGTTEDDLTLITRPQDFIDYTNERTADSWRGELYADTVDDLRKVTLAIFDHFEKQRKAA